MAYPQTIQIFLPDGNPRGIKIAEITNRTIKAILFPRNQFEAILQRPELANVGFYFLFGVADNGHEMAYIGEAEDCAERLKQHQRNKDFWNYAVVIISQTHAFTKTHVKYLEYVAIKKASETGRYDLDNSAIPNRPHITESMEADAEDCFEITKVLLSTLGFPLFDSVAREVVASTPVDVYKLKGNGVEAEGSLVDDGFVVFKDSKVKATTVPSCHDYLINMRNELIQSGILILDGEAYRFTEDYVFSSPSTAGGVILGRSTNGWTKWRTVNGKTLDEMKRQVN
ncbi:MAG: GIY-YIG nuclease family protein [Odoribacter sp.]|nr:GIY-YIG nuclease family protein [Odoribacter sp.]